MDKPALLNPALPTPTLADQSWIPVASAGRGAGHVAEVVRADRGSDSRGLGVAGEDLPDAEVAVGFHPPSTHGAIHFFVNTQ